MSSDLDSLICTMMHVWKFHSAWKSINLHLYCRLLAPATYIFFASVIPALAFGQQIYTETGEHGTLCSHG